MNRHLRILPVAAAALIAAAGWSTWARRPDATDPGRSMAAGTLADTTREGLGSLVAVMRARVAANPGDGEAAVLLADALMRTARVESDGSLALEAERGIRAALAHAPDDYAARRTLGAVLLSQHRFAEALAAAHQAQAARPGDAWNYAVAGDALLELGRYEEAFDAFDELNRRRPDPASYARAAYARELQGDLAGAVELMQMAAAGTGAHDPEAQAWYISQLGNLRLLDGRVDDAEREFARAEFIFPNHPYARMGRVRVLVARRQYRDAYRLLAQGPDTPETWAVRGDIARHVGDVTTSRSAYLQAERLEREGWKQEEPQPAALARFLAERGLRADEAVALARSAAESRQDIHTLDALAWSYFQAGQVDRAAQAIAGAVRTGTVDPKIRCHAEAIAGATAGLTQPSPDICDPLTALERPAMACREREQRPRHPMSQPCVFQTPVPLPPPPAGMTRR